MYAKPPSPPASVTLTEDLALAVVKYKLLDPSATSSVSTASTYALTDCCDGALELLSLPKLSSSIF